MNETKQLSNMCMYRIGQRGGTFFFFFFFLIATNFKETSKA